MTISRTPERASASIDQTIRGLARTSRSTLGIASVRGLMRSPRPAARIMAFIVQNSERVANALFLPLELLEQAPEPGKLAITLARAPQVAHHKRLVFQITVLAVPKGKARENPQHLELAPQLARDVPVGEKTQFLLEQFSVVIGQRPGAARSLNPQQCVESVFVQPSGVVLVERIQISRVAQIRKQQKALFKVLCMDRGHVHARSGEQVRNMHEGSAVLLVWR